MTIIPSLPKHLDARQRALRTFIGSLLSAVLVGVAPVVEALAGQIQWTRGWWVAAVSAVGLAAVNAAVAYVLRYLKPPTV